MLQRVLHKSFEGHRRTFQNALAPSHTTHTRTLMNYMPWLYLVTGFSAIIILSMGLQYLFEYCGQSVAEQPDPCSYIKIRETSSRLM